MKEYSQAKIYKSKPELRNRNVNADYFYSSAEILKSFAECTEFVKRQTGTQVQMLADICASSLGPLHMSPVTKLARLPGRILWCVHMGNFSPVDQDEFKKHNQNGGT